MRAKVLIIVIALLALTTATVVQAQTDPWSNSFRFISTGSTMEDELDLILGWYGNLDPARISTIEGSRLYTNLANFYTKNEEQFNPSDTIYNAETYLIGGKTDIFGYGQMGLIYDRNFITTQTVADEDSVRLIDVDPGTNPGWDEKHTYKAHVLGRLETGDADYYLGFARKVEDMKIGLCYLRNQSKSIDYYADNYDLVYTNFITGQTLYTEAQQDSGRWGEDWSRNYLALSAWKSLNDKMDASLRLVVGFLGGNEYNEFDRTYSASFGVDYYSEAENQMLDLKNSGTMFGAGGAYVYKWSDIVSTRFDLQFEHEGWKPNDGANLDYTYAETDYNQATNSTYLNEHYADAISGDNSQNELHFIAMNNVKWQKAEFGIGLSVWTAAYEGTETHAYTRTETTNYRFLNDPTLPASFDSTRSWSETWEEKTTGSDLILMFPVGVEFNLNKSMLFRLGARHYMSYSDETVNNILTEGSKLITVDCRHGDGSRIMSYEPNPLDQYVGTSNQTLINHSNTVYTYGAAWKVTENLNLDFMGFAKLTDLTNWKLSAVFKF